MYCLQCFNNLTQVLRSSAMPAHDFDALLYASLQLQSLDVKYF